MSFTLPFLLGSYVFSDRPPALWRLIQLERGGMPFHYEVGINCEKGATTEIKVQEPSIWAKGCTLVDCACTIGLDMTTPP